MSHPLTWKTLGLLATLLFAVPPSLAAVSDSDLEPTIRATLMDRHPTNSLEWWRSLGPAAPKVMMKLYETDTSTYRRMRLLEGLGAFSDDSTAVDFMKQQAEQTPDDVIRNVAIKAVGASQGAKEEEFLSKYLHHADPHTRVAAAEALHKMGSLTAQKQVDQALRDEKLTWVVAKIKGETPKPSTPLLSSGSSEDALSPELAGTWRGFWVSPNSNATTGMKSEPVQLRVMMKSATALSAEISVKSNRKIRNLSLGKLIGKGARWSGVLVENREELPCEAEMSQQAGNFIMEIRLPRSGGVLVLRRDIAAH